MMFDKYCVEKMMSGEKTVTRRMARLRKYFKDNPSMIENCCGRDGMPFWDCYVMPCFVGNTYPVKIDRSKDVYGYVKITSITREQLGHLTSMTEEEAKLEGFDSPREFRDYFREKNNLTMYDVDGSVLTEVNSDEPMLEIFPVLWRIEFKYSKSNIF